MRNTDTTTNTRTTLRDRAKAHPWLTGGLAGAVLAIGLVSCGGGDDGPAPAETTTVQPTEAPTTAEPSTIYEPPAPTPAPEVDPTPSLSDTLAAADQAYLDGVHASEPLTHNLADSELLALADGVCTAYIEGGELGMSAEDTYATIEDSMLSGDRDADRVAYAILDHATARCAAYLGAVEAEGAGA